MNGDIEAARGEARRILRRSFRNARLPPHELDDMIQNGFLALYGTPAWERPTEHNDIVDFLVKHAAPDKPKARTYSLASFALVNDENGRCSAELSGLTKLNMVSRPTQESAVDAVTAYRALRRLPERQRQVGEILADGGNAIDCHKEIGIPLIEAMRLHKSLAGLIERVLEVDRQERRDACASP